MLEDNSYDLYATVEDHGEFLVSELCERGHFEECHGHLTRTKFKPMFNVGDVVTLGEQRDDGIITAFVPYVPIDKRFRVDCRNRERSVWTARSNFVIKRARGTIRRVAPIVGEATPVGSQASLHLLHERSLRPRKRGQIRTLLEICCGTASVADELLSQNPTAEIYTLDIDPQFNASFIADVVNWLYTDYFSPGYFDMYWCFPPCRRYTVTLGRPAELLDLTEADAVAHACIRVKDVGKPRNRVGRPEYTYR